MKTKTVSGIMLCLLLTSMLTLAFNIQQVKASEHIYIRADGSIEPSTANITNVGNVTYIVTSNINDSIVVERDNIVVDGTGYTLQGAGSGTGITLSGRSNVTIKNIKVLEFACGVRLEGSSNNTLTGNIVSSNVDYGIVLAQSRNNNLSDNLITMNHGWYGILFRDSSNCNTINGNNIANNEVGIELYESSDNTVSGNSITANNERGIVVYCSSNHNKICGNSITANNGGGINLHQFSNYNNISGNNVTANNGQGIGLWSNSYNNTISGNNVTNNGDGVGLGYRSKFNTISGNNIKANNGDGIDLWISSNNIISENDITENANGIYLGSSSNNSISGNNITDNEDYGIWLGGSNNIISGNNIATNNYGIYLYDHRYSNNIFYHNNFMDNIQHVYIWTAGIANVWDNGYPSGGNYWSDYTGVDVKSGPNQDQPSSDGIGDTAHVTDANNIDHYPLIYPWGSPSPPSYTLTIYSSPTGVTFTVDGVSRTTPWSGTCSEGASVSLVMPKTHDGYVWFHWLEDGDPNRIKTVAMDTNITLTAVFTPDTTPPTISIVSPENKTYPVEDVPLTFTVSEPTSWIGYSLDGQANITIAGNTTLTGLSDGMHSLVVYASDIAGNMGSSDMVYFTVQTAPMDTTLPIADAGQNQAVNVGTLVAFDASGSTDNVAIVSCEWNFGDGTTDTGITCNHTYTEPGNYTVTLTVKDAAGNLDTDTIIVAVTEEAPSPFPWWILGVAAAVVIGIFAVTILWRRRK